MLELGLDHRNPRLRQGSNTVRRKERAGHDDVRFLRDDHLRVARDLGLVLQQVRDVGVRLILRCTTNGHQPIQRNDGQRHLVVPNGGRDDAQRLERDADDAVESLDFAGPAEVGGIHDAVDALERLA